MRGFHSTFSSFCGGGFDPTCWERHFLNYDVDEWLLEGDGVLQFFTEDKKQYSLTILHVPNRGFVLQLDCFLLEIRKSSFCKYAVADRSALTHFEEVDDGLSYPTG
jgi:hypothetical protein